MSKFPAPIIKKPQASVRLTDVAKMVGVSTATVSRALANPESVSPATRKTILDAVRKAGYTPNVAARNLRVRHTKMVLVVVSQISNVVFAGVLSGIDEELNLHGYGLIIGHLDNKPEREEHFIKMALSGAVDGILLLSLRRLPQGHGLTMLDARLPMVALNEKLEGASFPQITVNDRAAVHEIIKHLYDLGHRRFGHIAGPDHNYTGLERRHGFTEAVTKLGLDPASAPVWQGNYAFEDGAVFGPLFMQMQPRPTAIFAANDEMAIGFIKYIQQQGLRVPQDVSVVGFDGIAYAKYLSPTLTSVVQPRCEIGRAAALLLVKQLRGETVTADVELGATLMLGESTGPVKA